jgi:hypothetical protein
MSGDIGHDVVMASPVESRRIKLRVHPRQRANRPCGEDRSTLMQAPRPAVGRSMGRQTPDAVHGQARRISVMGGRVVRSGLRRGKQIGRRTAVAIAAPEAASIIWLIGTDQRVEIGYAKAEGLPAPPGPNLKQRRAPSPPRAPQQPVPSRCPCVPGGCRSERGIAPAAPFGGTIQQLLADLPSRDCSHQRRHFALMPSSKY